MLCEPVVLGRNALETRGLRKERSVNLRSWEGMLHEHVVPQKGIFLGSGIHSHGHRNTKEGMLCKQVVLKKWWSFTKASVRNLL